MKKIALIAFLIISNSILGQDNISEIPESCLYYFYEFSFTENDETLQIRYPEETRFISGEEPYNSYYSKNESIPYNVSNGDQLNVEFSNEALKKFISLELVDENIKDFKIHNKYEITHKSNIKINEFGEFYLPINNKKDSIHFKDTPIEAYTTTYSYVGEIEHFDSYLLLEFFEQPAYFLINRKDGSKSYMSSGLPNYSPSGMILLNMFTDTATYQHNESTVLSIIKKDKYNEAEQILSVSFKSWAVSPNPDDYFWISENEIVFKVYPIRKFIFEPNPNVLKSQYLKMKIL